MVLSCVLMAACSLDRTPLTAAELTSDSGDTGALLGTPDAALPYFDSDAAVAPDSHVSDSAVHDAGVADAIFIDRDASDGATTVDAGGDATVTAVDAYVAPPRYVGACTLGCGDDESCLQTNGLLVQHSYCAQRCESDRDCASGPSGAAAPRCSSQGFCRLPCDAVLGKGCPDGMVCLDALLILPGGDGTCAFRQ